MPVPQWALGLPDHMGNKRDIRIMRVQPPFVWCIAGQKGSDQAVTAIIYAPTGVKTSKGFS